MRDLNALGVSLDVITATSSDKRQLSRIVPSRVSYRLPVSVVNRLHQDLFQLVLQSDDRRVKFDDLQVQVPRQLSFVLALLHQVVHPLVPQVENLRARPLVRVADVVLKLAIEVFEPLEPVLDLPIIIPGY